MEKNRPLHLLIKPSSSLCNMRCRYCFYHDVSDNREIKSFGIMEKAIMEKLIERAFEYSGSGHVTFAFQGGEPTLCGVQFYKEFIACVNIKKPKGSEVFYSIQTNGLLIDEDFARVFADNKFLVGLSLDGLKEIHDQNRIDLNKTGTFTRVLSAARLLEKNKVEFNILCVVTESHTRRAASIYNFFKINNFNYIQYIPQIAPFDKKTDYKYLTPSGYSRFLKDTFDLWYRDFCSGKYISIRDFDNIGGIIMGKHPEICTLQGHCSCNCVIEANGNVYPCDFYVLDEYLLNNINDSSFSEIFACQKAKDFVLRSDIGKDFCRGCEFLALCRTGCRRYKEPLKETSGKNYFCNAYKDFLGYTYDRFLKIPEILSTKY